MKVIDYSELCSNPESVCDSTIDDCDHVLVHRRDAENVVMISESEFNSWRETIYLMSNTVNAARLEKSIAQVERCKSKQSKGFTMDEWLSKNMVLVSLITMISGISLGLILF